MKIYEYNTFFLIVYNTLFKKHNQKQMQAAEVALNIIIFLPIPSLPVFFATCSSWSHLSELEYIWHVVYERELHAAGKYAANSHEQNRIEKLKKKHLLGAQDFKTKGKTYVHLLQGFAKGQYAHHDSMLYEEFVKDWRMSISTVLTWPRRMFCNPKFRIMEHVFRHARHAKDCNFDDLHKIVKYVHSFGNPTNLLSRMSQYNATIFYGMEVDNEQFVTMLAGLYKEELKMSKLEDNFELPLFDILQHASNRNVHLVDWIMQADMFNVGLHGLDPNLDLLMDVLPIGSNEKSIVNFVCYNNYPNILLALSKYAKKPIVLETKWLQRGLGGCTHTPDAEVYLMFPWTGDPNIVDAQGESIAKSFVRTENECQADLLKRLASMGATFTELHNDKNILQTMFELDHFHLVCIIVNILI